jgi:hypothetical protein
MNMICQCGEKERKFICQTVSIMLNRISLCDVFRFIMIQPKRFRFGRPHLLPQDTMYFQFLFERGPLSEILLFFDEKFQELKLLKSLSLMFRGALAARVLKLKNGESTTEVDNEIRLPTSFLLGCSRLVNIHPSFRHWSFQISSGGFSFQSTRRSLKFETFVKKKVKQYLEKEIPLSLSFASWRKVGTKTGNSC